MQLLWILLFMALVGALIGGFTNHIAIKMLFRPQTAKYIGSWRVPFTPGLIPKRRDELARQLGKTVVEHLLTPETFKKRFFNEEMRSKANVWLEKQLVEYIFGSPKTLREWLSVIGQHDVEHKIEQRINSFIDNQYSSFAAFIEGRTVRELLPEAVKYEVSLKLIDMRKYAILRAAAFFDSPEGRRTVRALIDEFLASRGRIGNMIHSLIGESTSLVDRVQPEIIKFLNAPNTAALLDSLIETEWEKLQDRRADELLSEVDLTPAVTAAKKYILEKAAVSHRLNATVAEAWPKGLEWTRHNLMPPILDFVFTQGEKKLEETILKIDMEGMVREQVDSFPLDRIEDLVLGISRREFKMITVLGAILGGLIGLVQGLLVQVLNMI